MARVSRATGGRGKPTDGAALRRYAETSEEAPAEFAAWVLLEVDAALLRVGPDSHGAGPTRDASRVLDRAAADL